MNQPYDRLWSRAPASLAQPYVLLPVQQRAARQHRAVPETRLMAAVLQDAVTCFQKYHGSTSRFGRRMFHDAECWLMSDERDWPCSFQRICETVGINPGYLRSGLRQWCQQQLVSATREPSRSQAIAPSRRPGVIAVGARRGNAPSRGTEIRRCAPPRTGTGPR